MPKVQVDILPTVSKSIDWPSVLSENRTIIVAVSGGPDSVTLADVLQRLGTLLDFEMVLAHFNHGIRGEDSDRDEEFVRSFSVGVRLEIGHGNVPGLAASSGNSLEMAARKLRYEFLVGIADKNNTGLIATGHTANDRIENLLMRLLRGSGGQGLGSLQPVRVLASVTLIRPLLKIFRHEILSYLDWRKLEYRTDSTNFEESTDRGKIRNVILPGLLKSLEHVGWGNPIEALSRSASLLADDEAMVRELVAEYFTVINFPESGDIQLPMTGLSEAASPILGRLILRSILEKYPDIRLEQEHVEKIIGMLKGELKTSIDIPGGLRAEPGIDYVTIGKPREIEIPTGVTIRISDLPKSFDFAKYSIGIEIEDRVNSVKNENLRTLDASQQSHGGVQITIPAKAVELIIRSVKPGDRMSPLGMGGHTKKIHDIFVDRKIPWVDRPSEPLVEIVLESGKKIISALPGLGLISEEYKIEPDSAQRILIYLNICRGKIAGTTS